VFQDQILTFIETQQVYRQCQIYDRFHSMAIYFAIDESTAQGGQPIRAIYD
jgi:hypothetical protein